MHRDPERERLPGAPAAAGNVLLVSRPIRFEHFRYVGDKRSMIVYDLDLYGHDPSVTAAVDDLLSAEAFLAIAPQSLAEARNRGYRPHRTARAVEASNG